MVSVYILEDNMDILLFLQSTLPEPHTYTFGTTSNDLERFLIDKTAEFYFLDDEVPVQFSDRPTPEFRNNCNRIWKRNTDARIWYIGSVPSDLVRTFCYEHRIPILKSKMDIADVIQEQQTKNS